jgi:hypothetical protein
MQKVLRSYAVLKIFLIAATLSAWGLGDANVGDVRKEIVARPSH